MFEIFISYNEFMKALVKDNIYLIDIRDETEYNAGHIKGAINIPYDKMNHDSIVDMIKYINMRKFDKIVVYCNYGESSYDIAKMIRSIVYANRINLEVRSLYGGYNHFKEKNG